MPFPFSPFSRYMKDAIARHFEQDNRDDAEG